MSLLDSPKHPSSPRSPPCLKRLTVRSMRFTRISDLRALRARFTDQLHRDPIAAPVKAVLPTSRCLLRGEPGAITPNTIANMTRRLNKTLECTSATSGMHDGVSSNVTLVAIKTKYAAARSTSRSMATQTQPSSRSLMAMLQTTAPTTLRGPQLSQGRSEHFGGPVVSRSLGSSPTKEG